MPGGRFSRPDWSTGINSPWATISFLHNGLKVAIMIQFLSLDWERWCMKKWPSKVEFPIGCILLVLILWHNEGDNTPSSSWVSVYREQIAVLWLRLPLLHAVRTICRLYQWKCDHHGWNRSKIRSPDGEEEVIFPLFSSFMTAAGIMTDQTKRVDCCTESCLILCFTLRVRARPSADTWGVCWWVIDSVGPYGSKYHCGVNPPGRQLMSFSSIFLCSWWFVALHYWWLFGGNQRRAGRHAEALQVFIPLQSSHILSHKQKPECILSRFDQI